ncbi:MAG: biosis protein MshE, partial [Acidimicrobiaceae bacterium]|nr:biosis protein MshE [Acidimicrobiaceae bacterium]
MNPVLRQVKNLRGYENGSKNSEQVQLGQLLVQRGLLTEAALALALEEQARTGQTLGRLLIDASLVKETDLVATLASQLGLSFVDLS